MPSDSGQLAVQNFGHLRSLAVNCGPYVHVRAHGRWPGETLAHEWFSHGWELAEMWQADGLLWDWRKWDAPWESALAALRDHVKRRQPSPLRHGVVLRNPLSISVRGAGCSEGHLACFTSETEAEGWLLLDVHAAKKPTGK